MQGQPTVPEASYDEYQKQLLEELLQHFETGDSRLRFAHVCLRNAVIAAIGIQLCDFENRSCVSEILGCDLLMFVCAML